MIKALQATSQTLENRVNVLGVSEPKIQIEDPNRIRVQLAGKGSSTRKLLSTQANLTIRDAEDHVLMSGSDKCKQEFKQETNQPTVTFKVKVKINLRK